MTDRRSRRRYRKTQGRRVWVFSELNHHLRPEHLAKVLVAAGLEQARLEAEARAQQTHSLGDGGKVAPHRCEKYIDSATGVGSSEVSINDVEALDFQAQSSVNAEDLTEGGSQ